MATMNPSSPNKARPGARWSLRVLLSWTLAGIAATGSAALAAQWIVDGTGHGNFLSIQAAIDAPYVLTGDQILVRPGHYFGTIYLDSKDLTIRSQLGPFVTILDAESGGSVVALLHRGASTIVEGFTVTGGRDQNGGGVWIFGGEPVITRNIIQGNSAVGGSLGYGYGGGIEVYSAAPVISRNVIRGNSALDGGGGIDVYYSGPSTPGTCCPLIVQNTIVDNIVLSVDGRGGGILAFASEPRISSSVIEGNHAVSGGGIFVYEPHGYRDDPEAVWNVVYGNAPDDAASNVSWRLDGTNILADPLLGSGNGIGLWPRSSSPALDAAESVPAPWPDLAGCAGPIDADLNGTAAADVGALESRGEITGLRVSRLATNRWSALLTWDDSISPSVAFNLYAHDTDPFRVNGGVCLASGLSSPQTIETSILPPGGVRFYLVTGKGKIEGSRGLRSDGSPRPSLPACPGS